MKVVQYTLLICMLTACTLVTSCEFIYSRIENERAEADQHNYQSPFMGVWSGYYSGDENGSIILDVKKSGTIEVTRNANGNSEVFYTTVSDAGAINSIASPHSRFTLFGNIQQKSGSWKMGDWKGNWSVTK